MSRNKPKPCGPFFGAIWEPVWMHCRNASREIGVSKSNLAGKIKSRTRAALGLSFRLVLVLWAVSLMTFSMLHLAPGDPAEILLGVQNETPSREKIADLSQRLELDRPWPVRYGLWLARCLRGDFGCSFRTGEPVIDLVGRRLAATLLLALSAIVFIVVFSTLTGLGGAWHPGGRLDRLSRLWALSTLSIPNYWLGLLLIYLFAVQVPIFPVFGREGPMSLVLPTIALGLAASATQGRILRAGLLEIMSLDHVRFARAKGLGGKTIFFRHVMPGALPSVLTLWGTSFGRLLGGAVLVESVFTWPGLGRLTVDAVLSRDLPVVQACVLFFALVFVGINFVIDLLYSLIDPKVALRMRRGGGHA